DVNGAGEGGDELRGLEGGQLVPVHPAGEGAALDVLEHHEWLPVVAADLVDLDDVGMLQASGGFALEFEAHQFVAAGEACAEDHLQRHDTIEADLTSLVDDAHAAAAQFTQNLETSDDVGQVVARLHRGRGDGVAGAVERGGVGEDAAGV